MKKYSEIEIFNAKNDMEAAAGNSALYQKFEKQILSTLFSKIKSLKLRIAVLRNYETLPEQVGSRDIDFVTHAGDWDAANRLIYAVAKETGCSIAKYYKDDMFSSLTLVRRLEDGELFALSVDFFCGRKVYGVQLIDSADMVETVRFHRDVPIVRDPFVFLDKWVYHLIIGQPTPRKYDALFAKIVMKHSSEIEGRLAPMLGHVETRRRLAFVNTGRSSELDVLSLYGRLSMLGRLTRKNGISSLRGIVRFIAYRLRDFIRPSGIFLSISGPDGSGKTTVIGQALHELGVTYGKEAVNYAHFRPSLLPRIAEVAKKARAVEKVDTSYDQPHRAKPSGLSGSAARLCYYWLDYMGGYLHSVRPMLKRPHVVLFDRYYYDMIADSFRSRIALPMPFLRFMGRLLPLPQYAFFIHVDPEEVHRRKQELTLERIVDLNNRYGDLADRGWLIRIDNNGPPEKAASAIIDHIVADRDAQAVRKLQ